MDNANSFLFGGGGLLHALSNVPLSNVPDVNIKACFKAGTTGMHFSPCFSGKYYTV